MSGLGLLDRVDEDHYGPNPVTHHMIDMPSAQHGALHLWVFTNRLFQQFSNEIIAPPKD